MQGPVYHWTVSTGFSVADAANFYSDIDERWNLQYCVHMFQNTMEHSPHQRDDIIKIFKEHHLC